MDHGRRHAILRHLRRWLGGRATADLSDRQLLERFATGHEESAFATLVERHGSLVRGVCWRALRHTQDAEDVFQATFLVLAKKASALRWQESIGSWLYQVAYRLALKSKVSAARRAAREREAGFTEDESAHEQARREICEALDEELHQLPDRYRAPLLLCYLDGKTRDEAAVQLGWSAAGNCCASG
jgi:RNA polymerase sigma factor (sigma-70 family)